jgi:hypothetical protein
MCHSLPYLALWLESGHLPTYLGPTAPLTINEPPCRFLQRRPRPGKVRIGAELARLKLASRFGSNIDVVLEISVVEYGPATTQPKLLQ